jgi:hypothetical protein
VLIRDAQPERPEAGPGVDALVVLSVGSAWSMGGLGKALGHQGDHGFVAGVAGTRHLASRPSREEPSPAHAPSSNALPDSEEPTACGLVGRGEGYNVLQPVMPALLDMLNCSKFGGGAVDAIG